MKKKEEKFMKTSQTSFFQQSPNDLLLSKSSSAICYLYGKNGLPDGIILTAGILCLKITNKIILSKVHNYYQKYNIQF